MVETPDLLITGGTVPEISADAAADATRTAGRPTAVAVTNGRITAVGSDDLAALAGPSTRIIDAAGGAILPGLNDGHLHFVGSAVANHVLTPLGAASTWEHAAQLLGNATPGPDGWVRAHGWDEVGQGPVPERGLLDAAPGRPVVAYDQTGHQLLVNQTALDALGLTGPARDVPGGVTGKLADGGYNGHLSDAAMALVNASLPALPAHQLRDAVLRHQGELHALGLTSYTEPGLGPGGDSLLGGSCGEDSLRLLVDLAAASELSLRATVLLLFNGTGGANARDTQAGLAGDLPRLATRAGIDPLSLNIAGVKVFADGTPRSGTAWMSTAYESPCGHGCGHLAVAGATDGERAAELAAIVGHIHDAGLQAGVHATGDASTAALVAAVEAAQARNPRGNARHYAIHGAFSSEDALRRLAAAGMGYSTNPAIRAGAGALMQQLLGAERFDPAQPLQSALALGLHPNIASDAPVTTPDWRSSVVAAVTRDTTAGPGAHDPQRLSLSQALHLMTAAPAWQDGAEAHKGRVAPGQLGDLCVLARPLPQDVSSLKTIPATHTVVGGRLVHAA